MDLLLFLCVLKFIFCNLSSLPPPDRIGLIEWRIVPANFTLPQDPREKFECIRKGSEKSDKLVDIEEIQGSLRSKLSFRKKINEDTFDRDADISKLKKKLLSKFSDVFKKDLGSQDRLNIDPVNVLMGDNPSTPYNCMTAIGTPRHLQSAAKEESEVMMSGTSDSSNQVVHQGIFFIQKNTSKGGGLEKDSELMMVRISEFGPTLY